jgi:hypothetical protein
VGSEIAIGEQLAVEVLAVVSGLETIPAADLPSFVSNLSNSAMSTGIPF